MPAIYYHVFIAFCDNNGEVQRDTLFGLSKKDLLKCIVVPYNENRSFHFNGQNINPNQIQDIRILTSSVANYFDIILPNGDPLGQKITKKTLELLCTGEVSTVFGIVNHLFLKPLIGSSKQVMSPLNKSEVVKGNKIFIVHGRDKAPALELKDYLKDTYSLDAVIFDDIKKKRTSPTIIELLEDISSNAGYAFIVATPDDLGAFGKDVGKCKEELLSSPETISVKSILTLLSKFKPRARQNVVFEHGLFLGALGRDRVCCLLQVGTEDKQTDIDGVIFIKFSENVSDTFTEIVEKLKDPKIGLIKL